VQRGMMGGMRMGGNQPRAYTYQPTAQQKGEASSISNRSR
jgi:hypothetical protein